MSRSWIFLACNAKTCKLRNPQRETLFLNRPDQSLLKGVWIWRLEKNTDFLFFSKTAMKMFGASKIVQNIVNKIFQKLTQKLTQKSLISACFLVRFFLLLACNFSCNKQKNCIAHLLIQLYKRAGQFHARLFITVWLGTSD